MIQQMRDMLLAQAPERWVIRQTYALICNELFGTISDEVFAKELLPVLLRLAQDNVPNVRLVVARTFVRKIIPNGKKKKNNTIILGIHFELEK